MTEKDMPVTRRKSGFGAFASRKENKSVIAGQGQCTGGMMAEGRLLENVLRAKAAAR